MKEMKELHWQFQNDERKEEKKVIFVVLVEKEEIFSFVMEIVFKLSI
jgi:hypothetical protein